MPARLVDPRAAGCHLSHHSKTSITRRCLDILTVKVAGGGFADSARRSLREGSMRRISSNRGALAISALTGLSLTARPDEKEAYVHGISARSVDELVKAMARPRRGPPQSTRIELAG